MSSQPTCSAASRRTSSAATGAQSTVRTRRPRLWTTNRRRSPTTDASAVQALGKRQADGCCSPSGLTSVAPAALHAELDRKPGCGEIGYWVTAEARGRGIATRAVHLLAGWARDELGLTRIEILPHKDNPASRRVAEKAGFTDTGELVAAPRSDTDEPVYAVYAWTAS